MKQLVVISGKGGTGKTSLIACFAALLSRSQNGRAVSVDCDVDASNLHLLLGGKIIKEEPFFGPKVAVARDDKLPLSEECQSSCFFGAIKELGIDPLLCVGCGACLISCPEAEIRLDERQSGTIYLRDTEYGNLIHARLFPGSAGFGGLITELRKRAEEIALNKEGSLVLIDGSPGIGCQVIASLTGTDLALVVSEPSRSGLHDMERIISLLEHFKIKALVCINRHDLHPHLSRELERECRNRKIPVAGRIPYDPLFAEAITAGTPLVDYGKGAAVEALSGVFNVLLEEIHGRG